MSKETIDIDPRLKCIDLSNAQVVFEALGGYNHFDIKAYLTLPIGKRLLTKEEWSSLDEEHRKPIPNNSDDPFYLEYFYQGVTQGNGGIGSFDYNWDPINRKLVYENSVPDEMIYTVDKIRGKKYESLDKKSWEAVKSADRFYNQ